MSEKTYTFPNIEPQKPMTEEEFDKWAEKVTERQNAFADAFESRDIERLKAEMGGLDDSITPLLLIMGVFGFPDQFRKTTKEEVKKKYAYKVNPVLYEELRDATIKDIMEDIGVDAVKRNNNQMLEEYWSTYKDIVDNEKIE